VLEARTVVVRVGPVLEQAACMVEELVGATVEELVGATVPPVVAVPVEVPAAVAMAADVESVLEKSALLVGLAAAAEDPVRVLCRMWEVATEIIYRRRHTSMLGLEAILTLFDQEEISPASSQAVAC